MLRGRGAGQWARLHGLLSALGTGDSASAGRGHGRGWGGRSGICPQDTATSAVSSPGAQPCRPACRRGAPLPGDAWQPGHDAARSPRDRKRRQRSVVFCFDFELASSAVFLTTPDSVTVGARPCRRTRGSCSLGRTCPRVGSVVAPRSGSPRCLGVRGAAGSFRGFRALGYAARGTRLRCIHSRPPFCTNGHRFHDADETRKAASRVSTRLEECSLPGPWAQLFS